MTKKIFAILGGDRRALAAAKILSENFEIRFFGFGDGSTLEKTLENADYALLPIPLTRDGKTLNAPFSKEKTPLSEIFAAQNTVFFGAESANMKSFDLFSREDVKTLNAVPTAEGAIAEAIMRTKKTLWRSNCLVAGFGKIGKALSVRLRALGANVTVSARKDRDLAEISALGMSPVPTDDVAAALPDADVVFNTVPSPIFGEKEFSLTKKDALFIELASAPGGFDPKIAEKYEIRSVALPALPGRTAPETSGKIIADAVMKILKGGREIDG